MMTTNTELTTSESVPDISEKNKYDGTNESSCAKGERLFTQAELEKCIGERLMRERRNNASLESIKKLVDTLFERGVINASSYAGAEKEICEKLSSLSAENTGISSSDEGCGDTAGESFINEACAVEFAEATSGKHAESSAETARTDAESVYADCAESSVSDFLELCEKYPDVDARWLITSTPFISYCRGRSGTLCELYEGYSSLLQTLGNFSRSRSENTGGFSENNTHNDRHAVSALSSTGFSQRSASEASDFSSMLSPTQRSIAKRAGISYSEYARLLRDIPDGSKIKKQR